MRDHERQREMEMDESCGNGAIFLSLLLLSSIINYKCLAAVDVFFFPSLRFQRYIMDKDFFFVFVYFESFPKILIVLKTMKSGLCKSLDYHITELCRQYVCHICAHRGDSY